MTQREIKSLHVGDSVRWIGPLGGEMPAVYRGAHHLNGAIYACVIVCNNYGRSEQLNVPITELFAIPKEAKSDGAA